MPETFCRVGAFPAGAGTTFTVWAPEHRQVELLLADDPSPRPLTRDADGYWQLEATGVGAGARYRYRLNGDDGQLFPDPASRFQPEGVHGPSQVVDPSAFAWTDANWKAPDFRDITIYELHIGTFTTAGTYRAAIERLPHVAALGVTAIELMPVADFPGDRNWGYDGVALFAPARCYGSPEDLHALIDAAHHHGLAVFLDVVYNHLGPDGAYANAFSRYYFTDAHRSPWGRGVNLDGPHSEHVRRFFIENAIHWVSDYHVDGLRLDATHALQDESTPHFLAELTDTVRRVTGRPVMFVAEDHRNLTRLLKPHADGGYGLDGVWADDFHHQVRVRTAHDDEGYYSDFSGTAADIAATIRQGWFFTGQFSRFLDEDRGTEPVGVSPRQMVVCTQNHDQIGNRADGARLNHHIDAAAYRAASALLLLAPETPLLFMGQEWAAGSPFLFFTDHEAELGRKVTEGRRAEFKSFASFADPDARERIPDPQAIETFTRSRLNWEEPQREPHAGHLRLYRRLLALRRSSTALRDATHESVAAQGADEDTVVVCLASRDGDSLVLVVRLSSSGTVRVALDGHADVVLTTEDAEFAADGQPPSVIAGTPFELRFSRAGAVVLRGRGLRLAS